MSLKLNHETNQWETAHNGGTTTFHRSNRYRSTLNVDLPDTVRQEIFKKQRVNAAMANAKYAARCIANRIVGGAVMTVHDVESQLATYNVHKPLREFATRCTLEIVAQKRGAK